MFWYNKVILQAYRLEPLIVKHYANIQPLRIHRYDAPDQADYDIMSAVPYSNQKQAPASVSMSGGFIDFHEETTIVESPPQQTGEILYYCST